MSVFFCICAYLCVHVVMCVCLSMLGSSGDSEDCAIGSQGLRVPTQKSYSSSETLKAFDQHQDQTRLELLFTNNPWEIIHSLKNECLFHFHVFVM